MHSAVLAKVLEYCKHHADDEPEPMKDDNDLNEPDAEPTPVNEEKKEWDKQFLDVDQSTRFSIILVCFLISRQKSWVCYLCRHHHSTSCAVNAVWTKARVGVWQAANYLDIKTLLQLAVDTVAETIKGAPSTSYPLANCRVVASSV